MPTYQTPGVYVQETTLPNLVNSGSKSAVGAFLGTSAQGPVVPVLIESWTEFTRTYGSFSPTSELAYAVYNFFNNGGQRCWVNRVIGTGSASSVLGLVDRAATSQLTLNVTAKSPGAWGNSLYVEVRDRDATTGRFDVLVYLGGSAAANVVERFTDVSILSTDPQYVVTRINSLTSGSQYISITSNGSGTAFPNNAPKVISATQLTSGLDGSVPSTTNIQTAVANFDDISGPFLLNIPGNTTASVINVALAYAESRGDVFVIIDPPVGADVPTVVSYAGGLSPVSSYGAIYYPSVHMNDPLGSAGATRLCPPGPAVMGVYVQTDTNRGTFKAPAGLQAQLSGAVQLERKLNDASLATLNTSHVNPIRNLPGTGIVLMGARTLKKTAIDRYIPARRSLIFLRQSFKDATLFAVFEPNDANLWSAISVRLTQICNAFWMAGGLKGTAASQAYYVKCNGDINTPQVIANGEVRAEVGVALQAPAEFVVITIGQWDGGASVTDTL